MWERCERKKEDAEQEREVRKKNENKKLPPWLEFISAHHISLHKILDYCYEDKAMDK